MKAEELIMKSEGVGDIAPLSVSEKVAFEAVKVARQEAVKKWSIWCFNYSTPFELTIGKIFGGEVRLCTSDRMYYRSDNHFVQHLIEKWQSFESKGDARMLFFYCELDSELRKKLVDWVMDNYRG